LFSPQAARWKCFNGKVLGATMDKLSTPISLLPIRYGDYKIIPMRAFEGILWSVAISQTESWTDKDLGNLLARLNRLRS